MSTIKKLLALVLALTMVLSVSAAAYSVVPYGDAEAIAEGAEVAVEMLYNMGIMKGDNKGNFNPEATITRAEVAKMIYVVLNYGEDDLAKNYTGAKFFSDVESGAWYEGYVNYAASIKLVQGRPDGTFGPNDPVTCAEAAKMLLTAIGYSAEARGYVGAGWDQQVLSDASIIGLLNGYDYNTQTYAPRQWVAVMFKNALTDAYTYGTIAPVVFNGLLTGITTDTYEYKTMGEKYFNLKYVKGVVTANEYANLEDGEKVLSSGRTELGFSGTNLKVGTKLTDIGERREAYYNTDNNAVYYFGDTGSNVTFSTGAATEIVKKNIDGIKLDSDTEYFLNFESSTTIKEGYETGNGDWLKVVDFNDDGYAEYVFVTEFEMTEVSSVAKNDTVTLENGKKSDEFRMSAEVESGDIVLYTKIDNKEYVELADNFTGKVVKYTYKTRTLTVGEEEYPQSDIAYASISDVYFGDLESAAKKTEYTYYMDFFGNIRIYTRSKADSGELVLLTDAFFATGRKGAEAAVDAYIDGEITEVDVDWDVDYTDVASFIDGDDHNNKWGLLKKFADATTDGETYTPWTNIARTSIDEDGIMSLYTAKTYSYNAKAEKTGVKADYVDLLDVDVDAGETTYDGVYGGKAVKVQATKNTIFYYVDEDLNIKAVTGYKNSYDVVDQYVGINAMYAVATRVSSEASDADGDDDTKYWVADVIVIETVTPVFNLDKNIVLGYNVVNKTVSDFASLDVIGGDAALDNLNVTNYNGYNSFKAALIETPDFYFNTEDEDGDSHLVLIEVDTEKDYNDLGIYAETLNRVNKLEEYVVLADGQVFYYDENTVVYDMYEGRRYTAVTTEDDYEDALTLDKGEDYILVTDEDNNIIYAIWVAESTATSVDTARALFNQIQDPATDAADKALAKAQAAAIAAYDKLIDDTAKVEVEAGRWVEGAAAAAKKASAEAIEAMTSVSAIEAMTAAAAVGDAHWAGVIRPAVLGAKDDVAEAEKNELIIEVEEKEAAVKNDKLYVDASLTAYEKAAAIKAALEAAGCTEIVVTIEGETVAATAVDANGLSVTYGFASIELKNTGNCYVKPYLTRDTKAGISVGLVFDNNVAIAAGELSVVLYAGDDAIAEATNVNAIGATGTTSLGFYGHGHESSSWNGNNFTAHKELVPTGVKVFVNGVLFDDMSVTIAEADWAAYVAKVTADGCGCAECK